MSARQPLQVRKGDRTVVGGRLAEIELVFPKEHVLVGGVRVRFVNPPRSTCIVRIAALDTVGFGDTVRSEP